MPAAEGRAADDHGEAVGIGGGYNKKPDERGDQKAEKLLDDEEEEEDEEEINICVSHGSIISPSSLAQCRHS